MSTSTTIFLCLVLPWICAGAVIATSRRPNLRELVSVISASLCFFLIAGLAPLIHSGVQPTLIAIEIFPNLALRFDVEPLGLIFAMVASGLWLVTLVYSIGYMRGNAERNQTRFYAYFAISIGSAIGIAFAGNLLTLFVFYELLTLATYPLVTHKGDLNARRGGRTYLTVLLFTSITFLLFAMIWTWQATGTLDFRSGGILEGRIDPAWLPWLLALYLFGIGKAALMPFHRWLPAAMVAPTPVSALLHAVAVVKAGVFTVLKVTVYIFGIDFLAATQANTVMLWVAAFSLLTASLVALSKNNLKARLAYSTVSQLSYVTLGAMLASPMGLVGGGVHIVMHAVAKITLFFCAGAIYVATHKTEIDELDGLGRVMPFTFGAFLIGTLSIIGLPPLGGTWSKWYLFLGAADAGQLAMIAVLMVSSLLNIAYLMPIVIRGFFYKPRSGDPYTTQPAIKEAPTACVMAICFTAAGCFVLFFFADPIREFLLPITQP
ncbi:MAG: monovalent cation/H+ antiporter subunit D family protein [Gammaproteobacteria bacterium]|nr:monovalent cation/H+ antiporter subunit D family protein [Gammaproteobacteria bacterium]